MISGGSQPSAPSLPRSNDEYQNGGIEQVEAFDGYDVDENYPRNNGGFETQQTFPEPSRVNTGYEIASATNASSTNCTAPSRGEPSDPSGCALFTGIVEGVEFQSGSSKLTPDSEYLLESLALSLNNHPMLVIELQIHTESYAQAGLDMQIARERVLTVARFLAAQGVDVQRLRGRAFGSARPRFDSNGAESRRMNNRVELRVL